MGKFNLREGKRERKWWCWGVGAENIPLDLARLTLGPGTSIQVSPCGWK